MNLVESFPPVVTSQSKTLILGTMPGKKSLALNEYYANRGNCFWLMMGETLGFDFKSPYQERIEVIGQGGYALWDVLHACERASSLDKDIRNAKPNDFSEFFLRYPNVTRVIFNGKKPAEIFIKKVLPNLVGLKFSMIEMPSTSSANSHMTRDEKIKYWKERLLKATSRSAAST